MMHRMARTLPLLLLVAAIGGFCLALPACTEQTPLKIGFIGGLTGRSADLGVAGRDAVILAIEEQNRAGGIAGRPLELVVRDDRQEDASARLAFQELIDEEVVAIIGPMTSSVAMAIKPQLDLAEIVTVSPTVKTDQLNGLDDFFLRVTTPLSRNARRTAEHAVQKLRLKKFAVVYDTSNRAFTETWLNHFRQALEEQGGRVIAPLDFSSQPEAEFLPIAEQLLAAQPDGALLLSNAMDTALLAQQIRKLGSAVPLFASEWAFTSDLLSFGGRAVNGMISFHSFHATSQQERYLVFKEKFARRFGYPPSFATVLAHDATTYLLAGLASNPSRQGLKETLLKLDNFPGLQSEFHVDQYGDVERRLFLTRVEDGQFRVVD